jgi:probable HAF family extracellular repeat protein
VLTGLAVCPKSINPEEGMPSRTLHLVFLSVFALLVLLSTNAWSQAGPQLTFNFQTIEVSGAQDTKIFGVNNAGAMVGLYIDSGGVQHGLLLVDGEVTNIDDPNGINTECFAINNSGAIVGSYQDSFGTYYGFLYQNGAFTDIGPPGGTEPQATGINDAGDIVGVYCVTSCTAHNQHGFLLQGSNYTQLDAPKADYTWAYGINNSGQITLQAGNLYSGDHWWGEIYTAGNYQELKVPGADTTAAHAIDSFGDVVLAWYNSTGIYQGALFSNGHYYTLDDSNGPSGTYADGINDHQLIVGRFNPTSSTYEGFQATFAAPTTTTLSSSPNPSTEGQPVTFTAVVTSADGTPPDGETVSFMKGKTVLGTGTLSGGSATFTTSALKVGTTTVTAVYGGDSSFSGSTSNKVKQVVNKAAE